MLEKNRQKKLLADYDWMARSVRLRLLEHYPAKLVWGAIADTQREFAALIRKPHGNHKQHVQTIPYEDHHLHARVDPHRRSASGLSDISPSLGD